MWYQRQPHLLRGWNDVQPVEHHLLASRWHDGEVVQWGVRMHVGQLGYMRGRNPGLWCVLPIPLGLLLLDESHGRDCLRRQCDDLDVQHRR